MSMEQSSALSGALCRLVMQTFLNVKQLEEELISLFGVIKILATLNLKCSVAAFPLSVSVTGVHDGKRLTVAYRSAVMRDRAIPMQIHLKLLSIMCCLS